MGTEKKDCKGTEEKQEFFPYYSESMKEVRRKSRQAKYLSIAALVFSIMALIIRILSAV